jgi:hypothetical protein
MAVSLSDGPLRRNANADELVTFSVLTLPRLEPNRIGGTLWVGGLSELALQSGKRKPAFQVSSAPRWQVDMI